MRAGFFDSHHVFYAHLQPVQGEPAEKVLTLALANGADHWSRRNSQWRSSRPRHLWYSAALVQGFPPDGKEEDMRPFFKFALLLASTCLLYNGCTVRATTNQTTDTTSNITATTSGRTWFTEDGLLLTGHKVDAFLSVNGRNLEEDSARGGGEYLSSLAILVKQSEHFENTY